MYLGLGLTVGRSTTDGPLRSGFSGSTGWYAEFDIGNGPASIGFSAQGPFGQRPDAGSFSPIPRIGAGAGIYLGGGAYASGTLATPTVGQIFGFGTQRSSSRK